MPDYQESGLKVSLSNNNYFRFCECPTYKQLSGSHLKEMDFGWWDQDKNYLYLMELSDFSSLTPEQKSVDQLVEEIILKTTDCLLMLCAIWINSEKGKNLCKEISSTCLDFPSNLCKLKIIFVYKIESSQSSGWLSPILDRLRSRIKDKDSKVFKLLDINYLNDIQLLNHIKAKELGYPIA
jgi:hypothetical protein